LTKTRIGFSLENSGIHIDVKKIDEQKPVSAKFVAVGAKSFRSCDWQKELGFSWVHSEEEKKSFLHPKLNW